MKIVGQISVILNIYVKNTRTDNLAGGGAAKIENTAGIGLQAVISGNLGNLTSSASTRDRWCALSGQAVTGGKAYIGCTNYEGGYGILAFGGADNVAGRFVGDLQVTGTITGTVSYAASSGSATSATNASYATNAGYATSAGTSGSCSGNANGVSASGDAYLQAASGSSAWMRSGTSYAALVESTGYFNYYQSSLYWTAPNNGSDARYKDEIAPTSKSGIDTINALNVVDWKWRAGTNFYDGILRTGFLAQEVINVIPYAVQETPLHNGETWFSLHKEEIVPFLVKAVQELSSTVSALKSELASLKN